MKIGDKKFFLAVNHSSFQNFVDLQSYIILKSSLAVTVKNKARNITVRHLSAKIISSHSLKQSKLKYITKVIFRFRFLALEVFVIFIIKRSYFELKVNARSRGFCKLLFVVATHFVVSH